MRLLRIAAVAEKVGIPKSTLWMLIASGEFPKPREIPGRRIVAWREDEIDRWIESLPVSEGVKDGK